MVKVKTQWYLFWKHVRNQIPRIRKGQEAKVPKYFCCPEEYWDIIDLLKKIAPRYYKFYGQDIDIITLRNYWEALQDVYLRYVGPSSESF